MRSIRAFAPQRDEQLPLELTAEGEGFVGLKFNPVYNAQWKETGAKVSEETEWLDEYGTSRVLSARFI